MKIAANRRDFRRKRDYSTSRLELQSFFRVNAIATNTLVIIVILPRRLLPNLTLWVGSSHIPFLCGSYFLLISDNYLRTYQRKHLQSPANSTIWLFALEN